ncbi:MAG: hypothetical protein ACI4AN_01395 [Muribaculaceae bacterium]
MSLEIGHYCNNLKFSANILFFAQNPNRKIGESAQNPNHKIGESVQNPNRKIGESAQNPNRKLPRWRAERRGG